MTAPSDAGRADTDARFGVYIHVPFCAARCDYCAFATWTDRHHLAGRYAAACVTELQRAAAAGELHPATSVFVGGGTPSQLPAPLLAHVLTHVETTPGAEITVECNPEDATPALLAAWQRAGVTRLSLGVQSMVPAVLTGLGRRGSPAQVGRVLAMAGDAGIVDTSVDLIFGAVGESDGDWRRTLDAVLALDPAPAHVSAYALTVEPGTPLAADTARHPDDDVQAGRYLVADTVLGDAGYHWYEVSNWARPGHECRHNQLYWDQGDYRGIGCAAHSHDAGRRFWNIRSVDRYVDAVEQGRPTAAGEERLDDGRRAFEALALALRTRHGVPDDALPHDPDLTQLVDRGDGRAVLTREGRLLANAVTAHLRVPSILPA